MSTPRQTLFSLQRLAEEQRYEDYKSMLYDLYVVRKQGLNTVAGSLHISVRRLKRHLKEQGIPIRSKGGANNVQVVMTEALLQEIIRDGVPAVAERLGVLEITLHSKLAQLTAPKQEG